jgi:hypothetical protein
VLTLDGEAETTVIEGSYQTPLTVWYLNHLFGGDSTWMVRLTVAAPIVVAALSAYGR